MHDHHPHSNDPDDRHGRSAAKSTVADPRADKAPAANTPSGTGPTADPWADRAEDETPLDPYDAYEDYDYELASGDRRAHRRSKQVPRFEPMRDPTRDPEVIRSTLADRDDTLETGFDRITYQPTRHERAWLAEALGTYYVLGDITDVLGLIRGGKEASVYLCEAPEAFGGPLVAAKVYRPRRFRNLRNDAQYRHRRTVLDMEGKELQDSRVQHAIHKGTDFGKDARHQSWMSHEFRALQALHAAGADVPRAIARDSNVILMEYVGDRARPAEVLQAVTLGTGEARRLLARILENISRMLALGMVHGDLSAYNVLYWKGEITLIDFPQVVDPRVNPSAKALLSRDVTRVCQYFADQGVAEDAEAVVESLWAQHVPGDLDLERRPEFIAAQMQADEALEAERGASREGDDGGM